MKRTPLRHRSKKNSHPERDESLRAAYMKDNPLCELSKTFPGVYGYRLLAHDPHHIMHPHRRWDLLSNLIALNRNSHDKAHSLARVGTVMCLFVKHLKGELFPKEFRQAAGVELAGWLNFEDVARQCREYSQQVEELRVQMLEEYDDC